LLHYPEPKKVRNHTNNLSFESKKAAKAFCDSLRTNPMEGKTHVSIAVLIEIKQIMLVNYILTMSSTITNNTATFAKRCY
jgi:hypothetical protein